MESIPYRMCARLISVLCVMICMLVSLSADTGAITGTVVDATSGDPLPGANIIIVGEPVGASTNSEGRFRLRNLPAGNHTIRVTYIGYRQVEKTVEVKRGVTETVQIRLTPGYVEIEGVVVEALLQGQARAFNQQRNDPTIMRVVSSEQIERFADPHISDALRRVPGIASFEHRGETAQIFVRGLSPSLSTVRLDGERLPTTGREDREVSLLGLPSEMVASIEVSKAITPDMDADATGGSINLVTRRATGERTTLSVLAGGGYHQYSDKGNYTAGLNIARTRGPLSYSLRAQYRRSNRIMDDVRHFWSYGDFGNGVEDKLLQLRIGSYIFQQERVSFGGRVDYRLSPNASLFVRGLYNVFDKHGWRHQYRIDEDGNRTTYLSGTQLRGARILPIGRRNRITQTLSSLTVGGENQLGLMDLDYSLTYAHGRWHQPYQEYLRWRLRGVDVDFDVSDRNRARYTFLNGSEVGLDNPANYTLNRYEMRVEDVVDNDINARINFEMPYRLGVGSGTVRFGGRYFAKQKERDFGVFEYRDVPSLTMDAVSSGNSFRKIVNDTYNIGRYVDWTKGDRFIREHYDLFGLHVNNFHEISDSEQYKATENVGAAFVMSTLEIDRWKLLGGVRFEYTTTTYRGNNTIFDADGNHVSTNELTSNNNYGNFFPMMHVVYRVTPATNLRLAWTNTLARPKFTELAPYQFVNFERAIINRGNPDLKPSRTMNLDLLAEHYFQSIGMISGGLFFKRLNDFIYRSIATEQTGEFAGYEVRMPANGATANVFGVELAWQQQLYFLPGWLNGLGVYMNYTYTTSSARLREVERSVPLPRTVPHVVNAALSYERGGFLAMISLHYQSTYLFAVSADEVPEFRSHLYPTSDRYLQAREQIDLVLRQRIGRNLEFFVEVNNLTNSPQLWWDGHRDYHYRSSYNYSWGMLGVRYSL